MTIFTEIGLFGILFIVFVGPFLHRKIEHNLEPFLLLMGILSLFVSGLWSKEVLSDAFRDPLPISIVVLIFGFIFMLSRPLLEKTIHRIFEMIPQSLFLFFAVIILGFLSSIITAIIASLILVELIIVSDLNRQTEINMAVIACFAIGLGAALTPIGEPLSTIVIARLHEHFWYLFQTLGIYIIPAILLLGLLAPWFHGKKHISHDDETFLKKESNKDIILRAFKVYVFVMALIFLGTGFKPLIDTYVVKLSSGFLFWLNSVSAILDNATLASAEISPTLLPLQIKSILMALLISGGMLIPGNIPNIIAAHKLKITSREWAKLGVPLGLILMTLYFLILKVF